MPDDFCEDCFLTTDLWR